MPSRCDYKVFTNFAKPVILAAVARPVLKVGGHVSGRGGLMPQEQQLLFEGVERRERLVLD